MSPRRALARPAHDAAVLGAPLVRDEAAQRVDAARLWRAEPERVPGLPRGARLRAPHVDEAAVTAAAEQPPAAVAALVLDLEAHEELGGWRDSARHRAADPDRVGV